MKVYRVRIEPEGAAPRIIGRPITIASDARRIAESAAHGSIVPVTTRVVSVDGEHARYWSDGAGRVICFG